MEEANPGTTCYLKVGADNKFEALYITLKQQVNMVRSAMHISSLDGGHLKNGLYGTYQVLCISTYDGENELCILGFALVPSENSLSYDELLEHFLKHTEAEEWMKAKGSIIITDRGTAITSSINRLISQRLPDSFF